MSENSAASSKHAGWVRLAPYLTLKNKLCITPLQVKHIKVPALTSYIINWKVLAMSKSMLQTVSESLWTTLAQL